MQPAISIENLSKQYRLGLVGTGTLSHDLKRWWHLVRGKEDPYLLIGETNDRSTKGASDYVWALKDINFDVQQGEVLGIIGKNGAGKSTLLKILSKVTGPTTGSITYKGRIASLLEVGTGFNGELTGRENLYLNGAILGMRKQEIDRKLDEIIDFSGCERYIDTPVKRYSSGMTVRLGFAVAAFLEPEILVVDEVLAVGDAEFQKKAIGKMQDVSRNDGRTVLFVSHNMGAVQQLCKKGIILANGQISKMGDDINEIIREYLNESIGDAKYQVDWENINNSFENEFLIPQKMFFTDSKNEKSRGVLCVEDDVYINIELNIKKMDRAFALGYVVFNSDNQLLYWSYFNDFPSVSLNVGINKIRSKIPSNILNEGIYRIELCGGIHNLKWLFEPGKGNPYVFLTVEGNASKSPFWNFRRPTIIAPLIEWENIISS